MTPGQAVREWRKAQGWALREVAEELGSRLGRPVGVNTVSALESGMRVGPRMRVALAAMGAPTAGLERNRRQPKPKSPPKRQRPERRRGLLQRAETISARQARVDVRAERQEANIRRLPVIAERECDDLPRPCPYVSCRYHLFLDVTETGGIKLNFPELLDLDGTIRFEEMPDTCALDVAARGPQRLGAVGKRLNLTRERVRQLLELWAPRLRMLLAEVRG